MMCEQARFVCVISAGCDANCIEFPLFWGDLPQLLSCVHRNEASLYEYLCERTSSDQF